jgi:hypothetical protein
MNACYGHPTLEAQTKAMSVTLLTQDNKAKAVLSRTEASFA